MRGGAVVLVALAGCGDAFPEAVAREETRVAGDGGALIALREAELGTYAWTCGKPTTAWLVAGCCAVTTNPRIVGRSPSECAATLTAASCAGPSHEVDPSNVLRACGFRRDAPVAVFPRPHVENRGLTLSSVPLARAQAVRVTDGAATLRGVVGGVAREQVVVRLIDRPGFVDPWATWVVLTDEDTLAGVAIAPPSADHDLVAFRASALEESVEACQPVRVPSECAPLPSARLAGRRVPAWTLGGIALGLVATAVAALLVRAVRRRSRMRKVVRHKGSA